MTRSRGRTYDDDAMVQLIAAGFGDSEIAGELGVNRNTVCRIRRGLSRPDLQARIDDAVDSHLRDIRRHVIGRLKTVVDKHIDAGLSGHGQVARRCRDFVIKMCLADAQPSDDRDSQTRVEAGFFDHLGALSSELKGRIIEELNLSRPNIDEGPGDACS